MQGEDTPKRVCVQLWMKEGQRERLRARAAENQVTMTDYLLQAAGIHEGIKMPPTKSSKRWKPKAKFVELEGRDQQETWIRAMEGARGRELSWPEWRCVHALYLGLRSMINLKREWWPRVQECRAGRYKPRDKDEARMLRALAEFEVLRRMQYKLWDAETGHTASKRREHREANLDVVRAQDAARQRRRSERLHAEREAVRRTFVEDHVTEHVPANDREDAAE